MSVRQASHAGSWYSDSGKELSRQLDNWLSKAELVHGPARAIIAPHAGYQYCGACSAHAYRQVSPHVVRRVLVLGPSHHVRLAGCAITSATRLRTPLYDLQVDQSCCAELEATGHFERMSLLVDEAEHSIEMHLPFIAKVMEGNQFLIVPIMVGSLSPEREALYGRLLAPYLADPTCLVVVSSDFCHWGPRFRYTWHDPSWGAPHESIERLDRLGMRHIEALDSQGFQQYLREYGNTICGRHPIGVLLQAIQTLRSSANPRMSLKFLDYAQSSQCLEMSDSSVSYAAGALVFE